MASVSLAGKAVEPQSLSCAVDVTPGNLSGGPLGSAALIEQIKQAGAASKGVSDSRRDVLPLGVRSARGWVNRWTRLGLVWFGFVRSRLVRRLVRSSLV